MPDKSVIEKPFESYRRGCFGHGVDSDVSDSIDSDADSSDSDCDSSDSDSSSSSNHGVRFVVTWQISCHALYF